MGNGQHLVAKEGWWLITVIAALAVGSKIYLGLLPSLLFLLLLCFAIFVYRNPQRPIPSSPLAVVSPASGRVVSVDKMEDAWLSRKAVRFKVKVSLLDMHTLRSPAEGKIINQWSADCDEPGYNRRYTYWIQTDEGDDVVFSLLLGNLSPYVRMLLHSGERVGQGQYCGFLYYAGMVEIYMPENTRVEIKPGTQVIAGADILGQFVHDNNTVVVEV